MAPTNQRAFERHNKVIGYPPKLNFSSSLLTTKGAVVVWNHNLAQGCLAETRPPLVRHKPWIHTFLAQSGVRVRMEQPRSLPAVPVAGLWRVSGYVGTGWNGLATPVLRKTDSKALYHRRSALAGSRVEEFSQFVCMYIVGTVLISYAAVMIRCLSSPGADIADQPGSKV